MERPRQPPGARTPPLCIKPTTSSSKLCSRSCGHTAEAVVLRIALLGPWRTTSPRRGMPTCDDRLHQVSAAPASGNQSREGLAARKSSGLGGLVVQQKHIRRKGTSAQLARPRGRGLFHSRAEEIAAHAGEFSFHLVADPEKALYRTFGVEAGARALLWSMAWPASCAPSRLLSPASFSDADLCRRSRLKAAAMACRQTSSSRPIALWWPRIKATMPTTSGRSTPCCRLPPPRVGPRNGPT
jgi:hypothetical protein